MNKVNFEILKGKQGGEQLKEKSAEDRPRASWKVGVSALRRDCPRRIFAFYHVFVQIWVFSVT